MKKHRECESKHSAGWTQLVSVVSGAAAGSVPTDDLMDHFRRIAEHAFISEDRLRAALIAGWEKTVDHFLNDGHLDRAEETRLATFANEFSLTQAELDVNRGWTRLAQGAVLREVLEGRIPRKIAIEGALPFNLQKKEALIWVFPDTKYYESRSRRHFEGGSRGVSIRIAKGVYYRVGAFKGRAVVTTETAYVGSGPMGLTNKHVYFTGGGKSFRIRYDKIVSIEPCDDGVVVQRDAQTAKPQWFQTGDGWFTYNLLMNLPNLD